MLPSSSEPRPLTRRPQSHAVFCRVHSACCGAGGDPNGVTVAGQSGGAAGFSFCVSGDPNGEDGPQWKKYAEVFNICQLCNGTHMIPKEQLEKYRFFYDRLTTDNYTVSLFGLPHFTPKG